MFGNPGGAVSSDMAVDAFEEDVKVTSRSVCVDIPFLGFPPYHISELSGQQLM